MKSSPTDILSSAAAAMAEAPRLRGRVKAMLLVGSLARNEGTWLPTPAGWRLLGDADLLLIIKDGQPLPPEGEIKKVTGEAERWAQAQGVTASVSIKAAHPSYLRGLPPHIFGFELLRTGQVLWGDANILRMIPPVFAEMIPEEDAWRLLANRLVELLPALGGASPTAVGFKCCRTPEEVYPWVKLYLDMASSFLVFARNFRPSYAARARCLRIMADYGVPGFEVRGQIPTGFVERVEACTCWKLAPEGIPAGLDRPGGCAQALADAEALWCWELARLTGAPSYEDRVALWRRWLQAQPARARLRGWASAIRHGGAGQWRRWPSWLALAGYASPRHLVYEAAAELLFTGSCRRPHRPLVGREDRPLPVQIASDFHRLVEATRA